MKNENGDRKPWDMGERTLLFGKRMLDVVEQIPGGPGAGVARMQLAKAGTSIGANYHEAEVAMSNPDRRKCLGTSRKEANESRYWLRLIHLKWRHCIDVQKDIAEAGELLAILNRMINNLDQGDSA